jgi:glutathione S-transferase
MEELALPYEHKHVPLSDLKTQPYISVNPNGRVPALVDPNNKDITLWEVSIRISFEMSNLCNTTGKY